MPVCLSPTRNSVIFNGITQPESTGRDGGKETLALESYDSVVGYSSLIWWFPSGPMQKVNTPTL